MKKGIIFTIDALIALVAFLISLITIFSYFSESPITALIGSNIYVDNENIIRTADRMETFSTAVKFYQEGDMDAAEDTIDSILNKTYFLANMKIYLWNGTAMDKIIERTKYSFRQKVIIRKILVLTLTENLEALSDDVTVQANSSSAGKTLNISVSVYNSGTNDLSILRVDMKIFNSLGQEQTWDIDPIPPQWIPAGTKPGETATVYFLVNVPSDAVLGEYYAESEVYGWPFFEIARDPFNVIYFGMAEMEVGVE